MAKKESDEQPKKIGKRTDTEEPAGYLNKLQKKASKARAENAKKKEQKQMLNIFEDVVKSKPKTTDIPQEEQYLEATDQYLPFSTSLRADQYLKLKRLEYWNRMSQREIIENIMDLALNNLPNVDKELPESERAKLKQLKTANDYYHIRAKTAKEIQEQGRKLRKGEE
ncbi:hypothetical protein [uncultured Pontibacter sp.]|uniref:hypothetical protein n=1 Tax=uncultured Pontibacter sp. TaxID=453356 RepID=UPI002622F161|nr:hypothetical protein [uncultured Pontibacter sp.]